MPKTSVTKNSAHGLPGMLAYIPFAVFCAFLLLSPIIPDIKLTRPKLLLTETTLYGAVFLWVSINLFNGRFSLKKSVFTIPVFAYAASVFLFYIFSADKPVAFNELKRSLLSLAAYIAAANLPDTERKRNTALSFFAAGSFVAALYGISQRYGGFWIFEVPKFERVMSTFGNPIFFAAFLLVAFPINAAWFAAAKNNTSKLFLLVLTLACLAAIYLTQTRAAFVGVAVSAVMFIHFSVQRLRNKIILIAAAAAAAFMLAAASGDIWSRQQAHSLIWRDTVSMWSQKPLFGTGPGTFHIYFPKYASPDLRKIWPQDKSIVNDAHNEYLQYLSETGIAGFGIFLWMLLALFKNAFEVSRRAATWREKIMIYGFASAAAGLLAQNMFSVDMRFIISSAYLFTVAGFIDSYARDSYRLDGIPTRYKAAGLALCAAAAIFGSQKVAEPYLAQKTVASEVDFFDEKVLEPAKTIGDLETLAVKYPDRAAVFEKLGWVHAKEKNWQKAVDNYLKAASLDPSKPGPFNNLGNIFFLTGDRENAIKYWKHAVATDPSQIDGRLNLAAAYYYKGMLKEASDQLREVLKTDPGNEKAIVMFKQMTE